MRNGTRDGMRTVAGMGRDERADGELHAFAGWEPPGQKTPSNAPLSSAGAAAGAVAGAAAEAAVEALASGSKDAATVLTGMKGQSLRLFMVGLLTTFFSLNSISLTAAKHAGAGSNGSFHFEFVSVTLLQEVIKFCLALFCFQLEASSLEPGGKIPSLGAGEYFRKHVASLKVGNFLLFGIPGLLYCFDNNFQYVILGFLTPAELTIIWNFKIVATAVLLRVFLQRRYACNQWVALVVLCLGCAVSQSSGMSGHVSLPRPTDVGAGTGHSFGEAVAQLTTLAPNPDDPDDPTEAPEVGLAAAATRKMIGGILGLLGSCVAAASNVLCEWLVKRSPEDTIHFQNMQLYFFGIILNMAALIVKVTVEPASPAHGSWFIFTGFDFWVWTVLLVGSMAGVFVSFTLKFVDNIAVVFAHALAMLVIAAVSAEFFSFQISVPFVLGGTLVLVALVAFYSLEAPERPPQKKDCEAAALMMKPSGTTGGRDGNGYGEEVFGRGSVGSEPLRPLGRATPKMHYGGTE